MTISSISSLKCRNSNIIIIVEQSRVIIHHQACWFRSLSLDKIYMLLMAFPDQAARLASLKASEQVG